jgi:TonB family protein
MPEGMTEAMSAAAVSREWVGRLADGRFPLLKWLGGSQPTGVFLTELTDHSDLTEQSQRAVIKLVPTEVEDADARAAAWEAALPLSHPNLMKVFTHGRCEIDDVPCLYVVTEFADEVLAEILFERPLTTKETRDMLGPALDALSFLHANGLVHGRLNPSNIMAVGDSLKLTTYGACPVGAAIISGPPRTVCDAPETEFGPIAPASDVWSLGATIVEVLTKYPPLWNRARAADPTVPESMPEPFASIARRCLRSDPARRITLDEIASRLEPAKFPSRPAGKATSPIRRRIAIPLAVVAFVLAGIGILYTLSHRVQPPQTSPAPAQQSQNVPATTPAQPPAASPNPAPVAVSAPTASPDKTPISTPTPPPAASAVVVPPSSNTAPAAAAVPPSQYIAQPQPTDTSAPVPSAINPAIVNQILPDIVPSALRSINGTVRVSVLLAVAADGSVTGATLQSPGPSQYFANKALEASRHWKFKPALAGGVAVPASWTLEFQFKRNGIHVVPQQTVP